MICRANYVLSSFPRIYPATLTKLFTSFCLGFHGGVLWNFSSKAFAVLEVGFDKLHRRIWHLSGRCHTRILHLVAGLSSPLNIIYCRYENCIYSAASCTINPLIASVFREAKDLCFTHFGYNRLWGASHCKLYSKDDHLCAEVVRSWRLRYSGPLDGDTEEMIGTISCD